MATATSIEVPEDPFSDQVKTPISPSRSPAASKSSKRSQNAALDRLEVESSSTTSIPLSIPYYYITDTSNSFDTVNLLANDNSHRPQYINTLHMPENTPSPKKEPAFVVKQGPILREQENVFNQVPKRFSQFILDQQDPYMAQRLDNLLLNLMSLNSDYGARRRTPRKDYSVASSAPRMARYSSSRPDHSFSSRNPVRLLENTLSREISNSMGSQATIFSTRQDMDPRARVRRSRTTAKAYRTESGDSSLRRSKAIRAKDGWLYRMSLRIKKMVAKMKRLRFRFVAPSKRTGSIKRSKSNKLTRKYRANPRNPSIRRLKDMISAPTNNPHLGQRPVQTVGTVDDGLKYEAGAPEDNLNMTSVRDLLEGKYNHLLEYIDQQQDYARKISGYEGYEHPYTLNPLYAGPQRTAEASTGGPQLPQNAQKDDQRHLSAGHDGHQRQLSNGQPIPHDANAVFRSNSAFHLSEVSRETTPPPPPPHKPDSEAVAHSDEVVALWRRYLSHVVSQRIHLRQEISVFQQFAAREKVPETDTVSDSASLSTVTDGTDSVAFEVDSTAEKFNAQYYNRRSVLGDMLDYNSSDELDDSSLWKDTASSASYTQSETLSRQYGTVRRGGSRSVASSQIASESGPSYDSQASADSLSALRRPAAPMADYRPLPVA